MKDALTKNYSLKSDRIDIQKQMIEGVISTRWDNPELELELSRFDEKIDNIDFRTSITQLVPIPSIQRDREILSTAEVNLEKSKYKLNRAKYIKNISFLYLDYVSKSMFYKNSINEVKIEKDIYNLVEARELVGTVSRGELLRARVNYNISLEAQNSIELAKKKSYYRLLNYANITKNIKIDTSYIFKIEKYKGENPEIIIIKNSGKKYRAEANVEQHIIKTIGVFGEYEEDRGEGVVRLGISIPLAINNQKREEIQLAKLESHQNSLRLEDRETKTKIELQTLKDEAKILSKLEKQNRKILSEERILLDKFQEAYQIATINLLELQEVKNRLIKTQDRLIKINISKQKNSIEQNYILGVYND